MRRIVRPLFILSIAMLVLIACTRERPTPEPTATAAVQANNPPATASQSAEVITATTAPGTASGSSSEGGLAVTNTPDAQGTPNLLGTPTPEVPDTFPYTVQEGDTLGSIAIQFETDIDTLRQLNNLDSDSLGVGQLIYVPYREGLQGPGLPTATPGPVEYTVQPGDTLSGIALQFGVDPIAIQEANAAVLLDPNNLIVGTTIIIPGYTPPADDGQSVGDDDTSNVESNQPVVHVVQSGQGLLQIAALYGVSVAEITAANGLTDSDILRIGQELVIPGVTARDIAVAQGNIHIVQSGESLLSISLLYGVTIAELQEANELDNPDSIFIGQELIIPLQ